MIKEWRPEDYVNPFKFMEDGTELVSQEAIMKAKIFEDGVRTLLKLLRKRGVHAVASLDPKPGEWGVTQVYIPDDVVTL
jgi:hypothetical protein